MSRHGLLHGRPVSVMIVLPTFFCRLETKSLAAHAVMHFPSIPSLFSLSLRRCRKSCQRKSAWLLTNFCESRMPDFVDTRSGNGARQR